MKWLSNGFRTVFWCMALGAVILGSLSVFLEIGHKTAKAEEGRSKATVMAISNATGLQDFAVPRELRGKSAECSEALDALALCTLPKDFMRQANHDEARSADHAPEKIISKTMVDAVPDPVEASFPLLPVLAFGTAIAAVLLGAFNLGAILWKEGRDDAARRVMTPSNEFQGYGNVHRMDIPKKSATAAVAKERLLQFRA